MSDTENSPPDDPEYEPRHLLFGLGEDVTEQDVWDAQQETRDVVEHAELVAAKVEQDRVTEVATQVARKEGRKFGVVAAVFATLIALGWSYWVSSVAYSAAAKAGQAEARSLSTQQTVNDAMGQLAEANKALEARGQAPVTTSPAPDQSEAIAAAVLAKVLLQLPKTPTAEQVAAILQPAANAQVIGPSRDTLAGLVAAYFAPSGPGAAQIQAAVDRAYAANPPKDGKDGLNGLDGHDPPCLSEPTQCRGADGTDGADSTVPGPPPGSWSWPDPVIPAVTHTCTRSGGTDSAPDYQCT